MGEIRLEMTKMRRLHVIPLTLVLLVAAIPVVALSLFAPGAVSRLNDPHELPWGQPLLNFAFANALIHPILVAVLASRQTDIEHPSGGWFLNATTGRTPGTLCRMKFFALVAVVIPAILVQTGVVVALGLVAGIRVPLDVPMWSWYVVSLILVDMVLLAFHIWLSAIRGNQLVGVGTGLVGGFIALYMFLVPSVARVIPWGYYAVITPVTMAAGSDGLVPVLPPWPWLAGLVLFGAAAFAWCTKRLDRVER